MAFGLNPNMGNIRSYADALRRFEVIKPWRGTRDTDARPLDNIMSFLRREVYKVEDVVDADDLEYLTSMKEAAQWKQAGRRIDWA